MTVITVLNMWSVWGPEDQIYFYNNTNLPFFTMLTFALARSKTAGVLAQMKAVAPNIYQ